MRITLRVFVGQARAEALHHSSGGEVLVFIRVHGTYLRGNHFQRLPRTVLLLLNQVKQFRIVFSKRNASRLYTDFLYNKSYNSSKSGLQSGLWGWKRGNRTYSDSESRYDKEWNEKNLPSRASNRSKHLRLYFVLLNRIVESFPDLMRKWFRGSIVIKLVIVMYTMC